MNGNNKTFNDGLWGHSQSSLPEASWSRYFFFIAMSVLLCFVPPVFFLVPLFLSLSFLMFGHHKTFMGSMSFVFISFGLVLFTGADSGALFFSIFYFLCIAMSYFITRQIQMQRNPVNIFMSTGSMVLALVLVGLGVVFLLQDKSLTTIVTEQTNLIHQKISSLLKDEKFVDGQGGELSPAIMQFKSLVDHPEWIKMGIMVGVPVVLTFSIFFQSWISVLLVLRTSFLWRFKQTYSYSAQTLLKYRVPDAMIWIFVSGLLLKVLGASLFPGNAEVIGETVILCTMFFFGLQGFGVYLDFLTYARIVGFFRLMAVFVFFIIRPQLLILLLV
jgi:hypothetical protein